VESQLTKVIVGQNMEPMLTVANDSLLQVAPPHDIRMYLTPPALEDDQIRRFRRHMSKASAPPAANLYQGAAQRSYP